MTAKLAIINNSEDGDERHASHLHIADPAAGTGTFASLETMLIRYPRWKRIEAKLEYCREWSKHARDPYCLIVVGPTGVGKSTLIETYLDQHKPSELQGGQVRPVLFTAAPPIPTTLSLNTALLYALGDSVSRGTLDQKTIRLYEQLKKCQTEMIIIDEFQHFVDMGSARTLRQVSDWLKNLISTTRIPVVLFGLPHSREVLQSNPQLLRRFSAQEELRPFLWVGEMKDEFIGFLKVLETGLPIPFNPPLSSNETAHRLFYASGGLAGNIMKIVFKAVRLALSATTTPAGWEHLRLAYKDQFINLNDEIDPFFGPLPEIDEKGMPIRQAKRDEGAAVFKMPETQKKRGGIENLNEALKKSR